MKKPRAKQTQLKKNYAPGVERSYLAGPNLLAQTRMPRDLDRALSPSKNDSGVYVPGGILTEILRSIDASRPAPRNLSREYVIMKWGSSCGKTTALTFPANLSVLPLSQPGNDWYLQSIGRPDQVIHPSPVLERSWPR
jgi:hypothetical protein